MRDHIAEEYFKWASTKYDGHESKIGEILSLNRFAGWSIMSLECDVETQLFSHEVTDIAVYLYIAMYREYMNNSPHL